MLNITKQAAEFVSRVRFEDLPRRCIEAVKIGTADCIAVLMAGSGQPAVRIVAAMVALASPREGVPEIPSGRHLSPADAALVNGVAAHALDFDDVALSAHPSAVLVPAILAEGWAVGASGKDAITAYAAGYELWAQLESLEPGRLHARGFHPTAVLGTLAAAAACSRLTGLDSERTSHAIGISASLASGLVANFGTMTKPLHAGRAAQSGVIAARLAAQGFTAADDVLEHRNGFLKAHSPPANPHQDDGVMDLGLKWRLAERGMDIKRYPTCYATHRCIDAMLELVLNYDVAPRDVSHIDVHTGKNQLLVLRNDNPTNALEAKFSMQFAMAAALVARRVGLAQLSDEFVGRPEVGANMQKVRCSTTTDSMVGDELFAPDDRVTVRLLSGRVLEHAPVTHAKGSWHNPLTSAELEEKFSACASAALSRDECSTLYEQLRHLDSINSIRDLQLIGAGGRQNRWS